MGILIFPDILSMVITEIVGRFHKVVFLKRVICHITSHLWQPALRLFNLLVVAQCFFFSIIFFFLKVSGLVLFCMEFLTESSEFYLFIFYESPCQWNCVHAVFKVVEDIIMGSLRTFLSNKMAFCTPGSPPLVHVCTYA